MQINSKIPHSTPNKVIWSLKSIILLIVIYSIYALIRQKEENIAVIWQSFDLIFLPKNAFLLILVFLLIPINWAFEAWKWQKLASKVENITFWEAYKGVLAGLALSVATPMMIGDYAGKILMLRTDKRLQSIGAVLLGNGLQLYVSLLFGTISYLFFIFWSKPNPIFLHLSIVSVLFVSLILGLFLSFNLNKTAILLQKKIFKYFTKYLNILKYYNASDLKTVFFIASARYIIFTIQFVIILKIFQINLPIIILLAGIGIVFLAKTLGATLNFLGDLGVRQLTAIYYFTYFGVKTSLIASATLTIWFINVLLPVMVGSLFILQLKFTAKKS